MLTYTPKIFAFINAICVLIDYLNQLGKYIATLPKLIIQYFIDHAVAVEFLSDVAAFEGIIIGVSIPISLQVVNLALQRYNDPEIARFFIRERLYKFQYISLLFNIAIVILFRFIGLDSPFWLWFCFTWLVVNMVIFYFFIRLVEEYMTDIDARVIKKCTNYVESILKN